MTGLLSGQQQPAAKLTIQAGMPIELRDLAQFLAESRAATRPLTTDDVVFDHSINGRLTVTVYDNTSST